jgi:hypothetical protein
MIEVAVGELNHGESPFAIGVLARGMCDNPNPRAAFGPRRLQRLGVMNRLFGVAIPAMTRVPLVARRGDWIVGVCGFAPPGTCQPKPSQLMRTLPAIAPLGPGRISRLVKWMNAWRELDPSEPHWHLGPVAVEPAVQGMSVGSQMMKRFCEIVDASGQMAYLETEKPENVRFYERFGFVTTEEADVIGCHNWFMRRETQHP